MFFDSSLSCCLLLLASGSCIYLTGKQLTQNLFTLQPEIIAASIGIAALNFRSLFNLLSPFIFHNSYSIDPLEIDDEEKEKAESRVVPLHEKLCRIFSMSGLTFAIYESHGDRKIGIIIIIALVFAEMYEAVHESYPKNPKNKLFHFLWLLAGGLYGWLKRNSYCAWACLPYGISFLALTPENHCAWSVRRIINNYMMMLYVFLMLEAIREAPIIRS